MLTTPWNQRAKSRRHLSFITSKALQYSLTDSSILPCSLLMFARLFRESAWVEHNRKAVL